MTAFGEPANQIDRSIELRGERDDAHIRPRALDFRENLAAAELCVFTLRLARSAAVGCSSFALRAQRSARTAQAGSGLRSVVVGVDEVTLEVRRQDPRRSGAW